MSCKFEKVCVDQVPMPFGPGTCSMRTSECENPDATDEDMDNCGPECRLYEESPDEPDFEINPEEEP
jgi:hypothetical protein